MMLIAIRVRWAVGDGNYYVDEMFTNRSALSAEFYIRVLVPHAPGLVKLETHSGIHVHRFRYAPEGLKMVAYDAG